MRIQADIHVHTIASGHAFSTVAEIATVASRKRLKAVGIADHGPALPGGPHLIHFSALRFLPRIMDGVRVLRGVEANIVGTKGELDVPGEFLSRLDYGMIGFHEGCGLKPANAVKNTRTLIAAMQRPKIRVVTHPGNPTFPIDVPAVVRAARDLGVALEINNASFTQARRGSLENCSVIAGRIAEIHGLVCLSSDAHVAVQVGEVEEAWDLATQMGIQPEQVVNRTYEGLCRFLGLPSDL